ncbi:cytochrome P450 [Chaetomium fimeti]|uniref:Cytochrome P450 n=1 Tax=Chaetomium fimeti TaxID=1854472 RepID=A0AAE0LRW6_9PEZI|nr:cytochrome P450 [Chaetomium fimeti]
MITLVILTIVASALVWRRLVRRGRRPLPGPPGPPYIGPVHKIPSKTAWTKIYEWSKVYGPIYQFQTLGTLHVWIAREPIAYEILSKRAPINSDRPVIPNLSDNRISGQYLALLGRTDTWIRQRRLCGIMMSISDRASLHAYPTMERDRFLYQMCRDPSSYIEWVEQFTARTVSRLSWGTARSAQVLRHVTFGLLETISPSGSLPNKVNFLRYLPAAISPWKKRERARRRMESRLFDANVRFVIDSRARGRASPSFMGTELWEDEMRKEELADKKYQEEYEAMKGEAGNVVGLMAIAGALTIGSPIQSFLLAMCHHPEWQSRTQDEIDSVLEGRCPEWEDRDRLPVLRAVVKEVIRWRPPVPTGIPHASEVDDVYEGFDIPAKTTLHAAEWSMTRQEDYYPDPEIFDPGRWLEGDSPSYSEPLCTYPCLAGFSQFGFGRRTCQGVPIVEQDLFLTMGGMAWAFNIHKMHDTETDAEARVHWNDYTPLLIAKPVWFPLDAAPRSRDKVECMRVMHRSARERIQNEQKMGDVDVSQFEQELGDLVYFEDVEDEVVEDEYIL